MTTHTFVVPAFGEPPWLERCIGSLLRQTVASPVVVTTSTPNRRISDAAQAMGVPLIVNPVSAGIASDWNFALRQGESEWVTLAHQDDWYEATYVDACLAAAQMADDAILVFTAAHEAFEEGGPQGTNARVKGAISGLAFLGTRAIRSRFRKRLLLSFGNPVPCPSVMLRRKGLPAFEFPVGWQSNLDWRAWLQLADESGAFVYVSEALVHRALHIDATTTRLLDAREREDARIFREIWPRPVAWILNRLFAGSRRPYHGLIRRSNAAKGIK